MVYLHKWSPVSCRSSAGEGKFYHCAMQPTKLYYMPVLSTFDCNCTTEYSEASMRVLLFTNCATLAFHKQYLVCVDCWQDKAAADNCDNTMSSWKQEPGTAPVSAGRCRPAEPVLQARQPTADELCRPNPDELVLGFRRHRMNQQLQLPSLHEKCLTARQVIIYHVIYTMFHQHQI